MPKKLAQLSVADNLCQLAKEFKSGDPEMSSAIRREFKLKSKNDVVRSTVYLMEVIGSRDEQYKVLQRENKDLKELLDLKAPGWEKDENDVSTEGTVGNASSPEGSNGMAATGGSQDIGTGGTAVSGSGQEAEISNA